MILLFVGGCDILYWICIRIPRPIVFVFYRKLYFWNMIACDFLKIEVLDEIFCFNECL